MELTPPSSMTSLLYGCPSLLLAELAPTAALNHADTFTQWRYLPQDFKLVVRPKRRELRAHLGAKCFHCLQERIVLHFHLLAH